MKKQFPVKSITMATALVIGLSSIAPLAQASVSADLKARVATAMHDPSVRDVNVLLNSLKDRSNYILERLKKYPQLKSSYWSINPVGWVSKSQSSEQEAMIQQMDFAKTELSNSKLVRLKEMKDVLQAELVRLNDESIELKTQLAQAISNAEMTKTQTALSYVGMGPYTRESLEKQIAENAVATAQAQKEHDYVMGQLLLAMRSYGIKIDEQQIKVLFATVTGDQDLQIISAYDNVRKITMLIQERLKIGNTKVEIGREYYGMYALMIASLIRIHEHQLSQIRDVYLGKVTALIAKADETGAQSETLLEQNPTSDLLKGNVKANAAMSKIASQYKEYLVVRAEKIENTIAERRRLYQEVLNTYNTYNVAQDLIDFINESQADLNALEDLSIAQLPQLVDLGGTNIVDQLNEVTLKIKAP